MLSESSRRDHVTDLLESEPHLGHPVSAVVAALESAFPLDARITVLDAGCGFGHATCAIASRFPGCHVKGVDLEASVVSLARARARRLGVASRVGFSVARLTLDRDSSGPRFDVLLFLAAQSVFRRPDEHARWMQTFVAREGIGVIDRTVAVLPGLESQEEDRSEVFRAALGPAVEQVNLSVHTLSRAASLRAADLLMEHAEDGPRANDIWGARKRVLDGAFASSCSALYLARHRTGVSPRPSAQPSIRSSQRALG